MKTLPELSRGYLVLCVFGILCLSIISKVCLKEKNKYMGNYFVYVSFICNIQCHVQPFIDSDYPYSRGLFCLQHFKAS